MHIERQKNGYCDIAELILWLDANVDRINYNLPDYENLDYDMLLQKLKESKYINIDRFEKAFDRLQGFFASRDNQRESSLKILENYLNNSGFKDIEPSQTNKYANNAWDLHRPIFDIEDATSQELEEYNNSKDKKLGLSFDEWKKTKLGIPWSWEGSEY